MSFRRFLPAFTIAFALALAGCDSKRDDLSTQPTQQGPAYSITVSSVIVSGQSACAAGGSCDATVRGVARTADNQAASKVTISAFPTEGTSTGAQVQTDAEGAFVLAWHMTGPGPHTLAVCVGVQTSNTNSSCTQVSVATSG